MLRYLVFDPTCLRSGLCSNVEKGGGWYGPSKLSLELCQQRRSTGLLSGTNILTLTGKSRALEFANEYSSMAPPERHKQMNLLNVYPSAIYFIDSRDSLQ